MPADLTAFADHLGLERFTLLGHSMGGGLAFRYAVEHPERLERLIIVDSGLPLPNRPPLPNRDNSVQRALAQETFASEDAAVAHFQRLKPHAAEATVAALPNATLMTVPHTGHNVSTDDARGFRRAVRTWLGLPEV